MKNIHAFVFAAALAGSCAFGETAKEEVIDIEARKKSIPTLEAYIQGRNERLTEIADDIIRMDQRFEGKIDKIVKQLSSIKDSKKSGYRVSQIKMDAIDGLKNSIEDYQSRRVALIREAREQRTDIPKDVLQKDAAIFDERIEKRVEQIMQISKSFTQDKDVEKYKRVAGGSYSYNGWEHDLYEISDEWKQNRRDRTMNKKQHNEIVDALKKSVDRHEKLAAGFRDSLANRKMSDTDRQLMKAELARHEKILEIREHQLLDMVSVKHPHTSPLNRDAAMDMEDALEDAMSDLKRDMQAIFVRYIELNRERSKIGKLQKNLEARKKWIADYEKEHVKK